MKNRNGIGPAPQGGSGSSEELGSSGPRSAGPLRRHGRADWAYLREGEALLQGSAGHGALAAKTSYDKNPSEQFLSNLQTGGVSLDPLKAGNPRSGSVTE